MRKKNQNKAYPEPDSRSKEEIQREYEARYEYLAKKYDLCEADRTVLRAAFQIGEFVEDEE